MSNTNHSLTVLTVAYQSHIPLDNLANDLNSQSCQPDQWIIVNNSPASAGPIDLEAKCPIYIINGVEADGFGQGCNRGLDFLHSEGWCGWVWLLNPDITFLEKDTIEKLKNKLEPIQEDALIGTAVIDKFGFMEESAGWIDSGLWFRSRCVDNGFKKSQPLRVDWLSGCSLLMKPSKHFINPRFEESLPLYYEDIDLCLRLARGGVPLFWLPSIQIIHNRGTGSITTTTRRIRLSSCSYIRFLQRHCSGWVFLLRTIFLLSKALIQLPISPSKSFAIYKGCFQALQRPLK